MRHRIYTVRHELSLRQGDVNTISPSRIKFGSKRHCNEYLIADCRRAGVGVKKAPTSGGDLELEHERIVKVGWAIRTAHKVTLNQAA